MQKKSSYQGLALIQCTFAKFNVFKRHLFELPFRLITRDVIPSRAVPIPAVADASVSHSAAVGGSVVGVVGLL